MTGPDHGPELTAPPGRAPAWLGPLLVAAVLVLPAIGLGYAWDDYHFLANAQNRRLTDVLPDPGDFFYRPVSRGVYFLVLEALGHGAALAGHLFNLIILCAAVGLLVRVGSRLGGSRMGLYSGLVFAALGSVPLLVGWASGVQDLLAVLFLLAALEFRLRGRNFAAFWMAVCGVFSKETVMVIVPVLVLLDWILGRRPYGVRREAARYAPLVLIWAAIHPGIHMLLARGFQTGATGYVGMEHPELWPTKFGQYVLTLLNVPVTGLSTPWPAGLNAVLLAASIPLLLTAATTGGRSPELPSRESSPSPRRILALGMVLMVLPVALTTTFIRSFTPYYATVGGVGSSLLLGFLISRLRPAWAAGCLALFLVLGVWSRGVELEAHISTEMNVSRAAVAIRRVEAGFTRLRPQLPPRSHLLVSVLARGNEGIYTHMYHFQAPRVWYDDPSLEVLKPESRERTSAPEFFFVVTPQLDVVEVDPGTLQVSSSGAEPDYSYVEGPVRSYATGLAWSGEPEAAAAILLHMPEISPRLHSVHVRMAAMYLRAAGRLADADTIRSLAPPIDRGYALVNLRAVIAGQPPHRVLDEQALWAFDIPPNDRGAARDLMRWFYSMRYTQPAIRFARRLEGPSEMDAEASNVIARMTQLYEEQSRVPVGP